MSESTSALSAEQQAFIAKQPIFFVATAAPGHIDLRSASMADFRVLGPKLVGYLGDAGGGTPAHAAEDGRIAIMVCASSPPARTLRLHGRGRAVLPQDDEWDIVSHSFAMPADARPIMLVAVESVEESRDMDVLVTTAGAPGRPAGARQAPQVEVDPGWVRAVLNYWLNEVGPQGWFDSTEEEDARCLHLFRALWEAQRDRPASAFLDDADSALAALVLFDQFPRNMFRGEARAFATDPLAREIARGALERGYDQEFVEAARPFFYMPFMHGEDLADQDRSVALFSAPGFETNLKFALAHRDIIARFGRFPHRNAALGRETLPEEEAAVAEGSAW